MIINTGMFSGEILRCHLKIRESTEIFLSFSFCETHYRSQQMIAELPSGLTLHKSADFTASSCGAKAFWLQTSKALTHTLKWKLAFFAGAGPAPSASCRTSPTIFSHLSVWPLWGFFATVAIRSLQDQGLEKLKLPKQRDTFNSCLPCSNSAEVNGGECAGIEVFYYGCTPQ